jgi:hypothetical protein
VMRLYRKYEFIMSFGTQVTNTIDIQVTIRNIVPYNGVNIAQVLTNTTKYQ